LHGTGRKLEPREIQGEAAGKAPPRCDAVNDCKKGVFKPFPILQHIEKEPLQRLEITHVGWYPVIPEIINGVKANFIGVSHTQEFLKKNPNELKYLIQNSSLIITEYAPFDNSKMEDFLSTPGAKAFFGGIADMAKISPKKISVVDPITCFTTLTGRLFDHFDFRNVFAAYAIDQITNQHSDLKSPIAVIYGGKHQKNIISYLKENKNERNIKKQSYDKIPYRYLGNRSIRNYEFEGNQWQLKSKIPL